MAKNTIRIFCFIVALANASGAMAQEDLVDAAYAGVAAIGKQWNGEVNVKTQALYAPLHRNVDSEGLDLHSDISYGSHPLQTIDLWVSDDEFSESVPVLIYFHGGGLVRGDKVSAETDNLIYSNIGKFMARLGGIGINANYRLAPEVKWPSGAEDMRLIIEWVHENIAQYGGDPDNIIVMGNSAGSTHVATYLFHEASQLPDGPGVKAAILSSGGFAAAMPFITAMMLLFGSSAHPLVLRNLMQDSRCQFISGAQNMIRQISRQVSHKCMQYFAVNMLTVPCIHSGRVIIMYPM